jgi:hypothetical protein
MRKKLVKPIVIVLLTMFLVAAQVVYAQRWTFDAGLEGWHGLGAGHDVEVTWDPSGKMQFDYYDSGNSPFNFLAWPAAEVSYNWKYADYPYLIIYYEAVDWPVSNPVKILVEALRTDGTRAYCLATLDVAKTCVCIDLVNDDTSGWGPFGNSPATFTTLNLEIPKGDQSAPDATVWYGSAKTLIDRIKLSATPWSCDCTLDPIPGDISGPEGVPDCYVNMYDIVAFASDWLTCSLVPQTACWQ